MNWLTPFQYDFMLTALALSALVGLVCAVLSCFLVLKGWSLMGDAISHAVLPGVVIAYVLGLPLAIGAFFSGLFCAIGTGFVKSHSRVKEDTVMGVVFTGLFALGLVLFSRVESDQHLTHILFGNLLGIPREQKVTMEVAGGLTLVLTLLRSRDLLLFCFDPVYARSIGLNTTFLHYFFLGLLALTIVAAMQAVGIILVVAMLITPGCIGYLWSARFGRMLAIASAASVFSSLGGTYASFFLGASTGACIILTQAALFLITLIAAPRRGMLAGWRSRSGALRESRPS